MSIFNHSWGFHIAEVGGTERRSPKVPVFVRKFADTLSGKALWDFSSATLDLTAPERDQENGASYRTLLPDPRKLPRPRVPII